MLLFITCPYKFFSGILRLMKILTFVKSSNIVFYGLITTINKNTLLKKLFVEKYQRKK